eukprot:gene8178-799_t
MAGEQQTTSATTAAATGTDWLLSCCYNNTTPAYILPSYLLPASTMAVNRGRHALSHQRIGDGARQSSYGYAPSHGRKNFHMCAFVCLAHVCMCCVCIHRGDACKHADIPAAAIISNGYRFVHFQMSQ